ncbi:cytochrome p450, partial [Rhyzopertha dominica]
DTVLEEILHVLRPAGPTNMENIKHLKYLEMVVLETLRLFPVVPYFGRQNPCDIQLSNFSLPANTTVMTNVFNIHRNERYWPDPLAFKPERFAPENSANRNSYAFLPFAAGPRMCLGAKYAMLQIMVVLANIIRSYKVSTNYKSVEDIQLSYGITIGLVGGTKCTLEERKLV